MPTTTLEIHRDVPIATGFRAGGRADRLVRPATIDQLRAALEMDPGALVLGDGANLLVDDDGVGALVVDTRDLGGEGVRIDPVTGRVEAWAGVRLPTLINRTVRAGLAGLETLVGIPASVGGAVVMNAGGTFGQTADSVAWVECVARGGEVVRLGRDEVGFSYRRTGLGDLIVARVGFQLTPTDRDTLLPRRDEYIAYKRRTQPLGDRSCGCMFRNPVLGRAIDGVGRAGERVSAGLLIDRAGCKGLREGSAAVSEVHANFITVDAGGRARDVLSLAGRVRERVAERFGVVLEREVVVWGRDL